MCVHPYRGVALEGVDLVLWPECGRADRIDFYFEPNKKEIIDQNEVFC